MSSRGAHECFSLSGRLAHVVSIERQRCHVLDIVVDLHAERVGVHLKDFHVDLFGPTQRCSSLTVLISASTTQDYASFGRVASLPSLRQPWPSAMTGIPLPSQEMRHLSVAFIQGVC